MKFYKKTLNLVKSKGNFLTKGIYLTIILTDKCPLMCPYCPMTLRGRKRANHAECSIDEWKKFIENQFHWISQINISGGEPSLVPWMPEFVNWLVDRGHHVSIYSNLWKPKILSRLKKSFKLQIVSDFHHSDNLERFLKSYNQLKDKVRINVEEIEKPQQILFSTFVDKFTDEELENFNSIHVAPDSPRTKRYYMGCEPIYAEAK